MKRPLAQIIAAAAALFTMAWTTSPVQAGAYEDYLSSFLQQPIQARKKVDLAALDMDRLDRDAQSSPGTNLLGAHILLGWKRHAKLYEEVLGIRIKDQRGREAFLRLSSRANTDPRLLGLVLELLLDPATENPVRRDVEVYAQLLITPMAAKFRAPLLEALNKATNNPVRASIARLVAKVEPDPAKLAELAKTEFTKESASTAVADNLLSGAADRIDKQQQQLNIRRDRFDASESKIAVTQSLREALPSAEGAKRAEIIHTLGDMGAENGDKLIADYLKGNIPETEQAWALSRLARYTTPEAEQALIQSTANESFPMEIRLLAIEQFAGRAFSMNGLDTMRSILGNTDSPGEHKFAALKVVEGWLSVAVRRGDETQRAAIAGAVNATPSLVYEDLGKNGFAIKELKTLQNDELMPFE